MTERIEVPTQELKERTTDVKGEPPEIQSFALESHDNRGVLDHRLIHRFLFAVDLCLIWAGAGCSHEISLLCARMFHQATPFVLWQTRVIGGLLLYSLLIVVFMQLQGEYASLWKRTFQHEIQLLAKSIASAVFVTGACLYLLAIPIESASFVLLTIALTWILLAAWRKLLRSQSIAGLSEMRNVVIVGCGPIGALLRNHLENTPELGYVFKGYVDRRLTGKPPDPDRNIEEGRILGPVDKLETIVRTHFVDEIFVSIPSDRHLVKLVAHNARRARVPMRVIPDLYDGLAIGQPIEYVGQFPTLMFHHRSIPTFQLIMKRLMDIAISAFALVLLMPFLLIITVIIKMDSNGPVLYESIRIGKKGKTFLCYKFRTMVENAEDLKKSLMHLNERDMILFKISADPRVTRTGRFLRKYSVDELPQLWNVLKGDMSLVGPRPLPGERDQFALDHLCRLDVMPGITGLWQIKGRQDPTFDSCIELDKEYVNNWSIWLDCKILLQTIGVVFAGTGQ